ncbi:MAG: hydroxyacylglutathione hydrolase [Gammaproteobacteria bacterium]|nr:hydroxyacylglutathione hydrolase [Gammaproteobacteria bacterium]HBW82892.1 hydroxyacylglutathione hydrolase [Gammaproteobacteria bacterium]
MFNSIHPIPALQDNYIWAITNQQGTELAVVDPGDPAPVIQLAEQLGLRLSHILITHHHKDHTGGLASLEKYSRPKVIGPRSNKIRGITEYVADGDTFHLFGVELTVIGVPGHTLDHIAFAAMNCTKPVLFCGDTLFAGGCGRLFEGHPQMMSESLSKLSSLDDHTKVYCTHEYTLSNLAFATAANPNNKMLRARLAAEQEKRNLGRPTLPSTIRLELDTNPFLRCKDVDIIEVLKKRTEVPLETPVEVFGALRSWKDNF